MPELAQFQIEFAQALLASPAAGPPPPAAMAVYRNTWRKALVEALEANYPVVATLLGEEASRALALEFVGAYGAPSPVLAGFGSGFSAFLGRHSILEAVPYLADVARIERLITEAHLAPDAEPMPLAGFIEGAERHCANGVSLHPAVRFCWLETPARTIWEAHQPTSFDGFAPEWKAEGALVRRPGPAVSVEPLGAGEHALLATLRSGASLKDALGRAEETEPATDPSATLVRLASAGTFVEFVKEN